MITSFKIDPAFGEYQRVFFEMLGREGTYNINFNLSEGTPFYDVANCDCKWGSWYGQTGKNRENKKVCKHLEECLSFLKREGWINPDWREEK